MGQQRSTVQKLISLPRQMARRFGTLPDYPSPQWYATCDPVGRPLGSGGGTAHLLDQAWKATGEGTPFASWLNASPKLVLHGGGQSRRLPAYAAAGKLFIPLPVFRWMRGQRLDQTLLDVQCPDYERVLQHAPRHFKLMIASGDVLLRFARHLPEFPEVDVLGLGMWVSPEIAKDFGVFFSSRENPGEIAFFLQKPSVDRQRELTTEYLPLVDTGMWLLSERAVRVLLGQCGWDPERQAFAGGQVGTFDLYGQFGPALGRQPEHPHQEISQLTTAVVPLPEAQFYHLGTSRQLIETMSRIQSLEVDESKVGLMGARQFPTQFLQNCRFGVSISLERNHTLWVENSVVPANWELRSEHVLTGVPENQWNLRVEPGICLDFTPVDEGGTCYRPYHIDDAFRGAMGDPKTRWLGQPIAEWFAKRGLSLGEAGLDPRTDIQDAALFPVFAAEQEISPEFVAWMFAANPESRPDLGRQWLERRRLSATELCQCIDLERYFEGQSARRRASMPTMLSRARFSIFYKLDLLATARLYDEAGYDLPPADHAERARLEPMQQVREQMFRSAVLRRRKAEGWEKHGQRAFEIMRRLIVENGRLGDAHPVKKIFDDQIIWARCPVRFDLAGGWTDTPPYCLENGGRVVNVAVDLNGQPPVQVFARVCEQPELVLRSIDLGLERHIRTFEELDTFHRLDHTFPLAKAALAIAGFLPAFHPAPKYKTLEEQLRDFGGGIEVSMLAAVPKGSGLGTSSILAATLLSALSDLCGLEWNQEALFLRTLALEQLLTTGGGWQDQAGGIYRGIKLIETRAGLAQRPMIQWLPEHLFSDPANQTVLLYYTGVTRLAKNILDEIVRGIFLNSGPVLRILEAIGENARTASEAIQRCDYGGLVRAVRTSWELNQALDSGTNPPAVQAILERVGDSLDATKLLGAGGGGYMIMFAKDPDAANRIRRTLTENPPNPTARFVTFAISQTGLQRSMS